MRAKAQQIKGGSCMIFKISSFIWFLLVPLQFYLLDDMPSSSSIPWALALILLAILSRTAHGTTCYYPNGDPVNNDEYTPCRNSTDYTMCCRTGGLVPDTCDENGLCYNICDQMGSGCHNDPGTYWRESCTDRSWQSPYCLQHVCTDKTVSSFIINQ